MVAVAVAVRDEQLVCGPLVPFKPGRDEPVDCGPQREQLGVGGGAGVEQQGPVVAEQ
jgi:hypothetical protein